MATIAAGTSFSPLAKTLPTSPSLNSPRSSSLPIHQKNTLKFFAISTSQNRGLHATSRVQAPEQEAEFVHFVKYHGLGNDFILVDNRDSMEPKVTPELAVILCDRNFGIGADGVILVMPGTNGTDYTTRIFNSDGSEPEMCDIGVQRLAGIIADLENLKGKQSLTMHTGAGLVVPENQEYGKVRVDMGEPILRAPEVPTRLNPTEDESAVKAKLDVDGSIWNVTCVSMGKPHCVTFGAESSEDLQVDELNLAKIGPKFEQHAMFPDRTNTEFVQVLSRSHLKMRVWKRGAGATLACGAGACAAVVAAVLEDRSGRSCTVDLPGGPLDIEWRESDNHVYMTGPAEVFWIRSPLIHSWNNQCWDIVE